MPRPLRIEFENAWYHVMNRGANHQAIYKSPFHRHLFYTLLNEIVDQFQVEIHAFCLMNNHYHLLIKTPYANLSKAMRHLDGLYTQRFNRYTERDGSLFRGRYKAILVDSDEYILQVSRYIHLNPVTADICKYPAEFKWSSYRAYVKEKAYIGWLTTSYILSQMTGAHSRRVYCDYVMQGVDDETQHFYSKKQLPTIYGKDVFIKTHLNNLEASYVPSVLTDINRTIPLPDKDTILHYVMDYFHMSAAELSQARCGRKNVGRLVAVYLLRKLGHLTHKEISKLFDIKSKSVSPLMVRIKKSISKDFLFKSHIQEITKRITC